MIIEHRQRQRPEDADSFMEKTSDGRCLCLCFARNLRLRAV